MVCMLQVFQPANSFFIYSESELGNVVEDIAKSEGTERLQEMVTDYPNVASVFVGRDTRYVTYGAFI